MMRLARRLGGWMLDLACLVVAPIAATLNVRLIAVDGARIGDTAANIGWFVASSRLGWIPRWRAVVVPMPTLRYANPCYMEYWRHYVRVVSGRLEHRFFFRLMNRGRLLAPVVDVTLPDGRTVFRDNALMLTQRQWDLEHRGPLLRLMPGHERRGREALASLGLDEDQWFVALHVRESGYLNEPVDSYRLHRNAEVSTYLPAAARIVERGGWVIRVGDPSMRPLPALDRVIDYVHSPVHSDWMDVFLAAACRFLLGTSSGLFVVAWSFGRPCALGNFDSLSRPPWGSRDVFIPKLWRLRSEGRLLTFKETMRPPYSNVLHRRVRPSELERLGVVPVDNSADELLDLVEEMFVRERGLPPGEEEMRLADAFERAVGSNVIGSGGRVSSRFLARHRDLLRDA